MPPTGKLFLSRLIGLYGLTRQYLSRGLIILLSLGAGCFNAVAQSHISAYVVNQFVKIKARTPSRSSTR